MRQGILGRVDVHSTRRGGTIRLLPLSLAHGMLSNLFVDRIPIPIPILHPHIPILIPILIPVPNNTPPLTPRPTPTLTTRPTPALAPAAPLMHEPHRLLEHEEVPLEALGPVLHVAELLDLAAALVQHLQQLVVLAAQVGQRALDVPLLLLDGGLVGVQQRRAGLQLVVQRVADARHQRRARLRDLLLLRLRGEVRGVGGRCWGAGGGG